MMKPKFVPLIFVFFPTTATAFSTLIHPSTWSFRGIYPIAYERAVLEPTEPAVQPLKEESYPEETSNQTPVLLLNGFGVGSFHQHRLIQELFGDDHGQCHRGRVIYTMDYLGQGKSWPIDSNHGKVVCEQGLRYCGHLWIEQILDFIEQVVLREGSRSKVHLVGNSVGGHLAVFCAAKRPDLIESIVLLNATPFWGFNLPGWSGNLPVPFLPKMIGTCLLDRMRHPKTIISILNEIYANAEAHDEDLVSQMQAAAANACASEAFASILWSPSIVIELPDKTKAKFDACLRAVQCPALLVFGACDPWCTTAFAKRMLMQLAQRRPRNAQRYIELSRVGHCPNHEAPKAVAQILSSWLDADNYATVPLVSSPFTVVHETWGATELQERLLDEVSQSYAGRLTAAFTY